MAKMQRVDVIIPTEEEIKEKFTEEELEAHIEALDNVKTFEELIELLRKFGAEVEELDYDQLDEELAGPGDTVH